MNSVKKASKVISIDASKDTSIDIRPVSVDDFEDVCKICCDDLGYQCDKYLVKERISQLDPAREAVFVAVSDDKVVGYIHVEKYLTLYFEPIGNERACSISFRISSTPPCEAASISIGS